MARLIKATGEIIEVKPKSTAKKPKFTLDELQHYVGGYIERVEIDIERKRMDMICNEEGQLKGLPVNYGACRLTGMLIVGDVVVVARGEW